VALRAYRFEHPKTERSVTIRRSSYLWAGLLGAGYVWWIGTGSILQALAINIAFAFAIGVVAVTLGTSILSSLQQLLILLVLVPVAILAQGSMMISLIREGFRRRGWMIRLA
jgi:hypothetical protein